MEIIKNISKKDKVARIAIILTLLVIVSIGLVQGIVGNICMALCLILLATVVLGFCPIYAFFGVRTRK